MMDKLFEIVNVNKTDLLNQLDYKKPYSSVMFVFRQ
jgi:hypothetical protein